MATQSPVSETKQRRRSNSVEEEEKENTCQKKQKVEDEKKDEKVEDEKKEEKVEDEKVEDEKVEKEKEKEEEKETTKEEKEDVGICSDNQNDDIQNETERKELNMSMNINKPKGGKGAMAPTPNNTPNLSAPIQKGNKNEHPAEAKGSLAGAISDKLASMSVEEEGGFYDSLPKEIKRRVFALENIQSKHAELEFQFREEVLALEAKYLGLYKPLYQRRSEIINGKVEPTDEEAKNPEGAEEEPEEKPAEKGGKGKKGKQGKAESPAPTIQGIPEFWLTALRTHPLISTMITENDEPLLAAINDIRLSYIDNNHGFVIEFEFADNEFFTNKTLTKTYYLENSADQGYDDLVYSRSEGCTIDWKQGKNLTVKVETKKQRHKGTKKTRVVKKLVPQETFFNFFKTPAVPTENEDEEDEDEEEGAGGLEDALETDFEMGEILKTKIIPHAIDWFTGKALEYDDYFDQYDEEEDGEDYDDEEDDEDDDDDDVPAGNWRKK